ncbi:BZ3500_MvSof-1268-A1-R1_Chr5-1g07588 [Microbotryum saponariae]|uniref:BZ3500_MvSof-1268-A1-R1_Chr5-1g07588 protein n=1 Tax=Microbotryum saponariae TaxID=289078 RepID=A0A2X0LI18_9BASI|nr:BZ3500_MvSof-1268-A1-R1_Chr5-1g07588 [Microbotryum saponariae]SDA05459.1 BZ3501_MvSof-1269-A2-R1_Chr5-2g07412 [Microbotryum saponariae]
MNRSSALVKIYGMDLEERSLVFGQHPRVEARLVSLYWIIFRSAPTAQQASTRDSAEGGQSGAVRLHACDAARARPQLALSWDVKRQQYSTARWSPR